MATPASAQGHDRYLRTVSEADLWKYGIDRGQRQPSRVNWKVGPPKAYTVHPLYTLPVTQHNEWKYDVRLYRRSAPLCDVQAYRGLRAHGRGWSPASASTADIECPTPTPEDDANIWL